MTLRAFFCLKTGYYLKMCTINELYFVFRLNRLFIYGNVVGSHWRDLVQLIQVWIYTHRTRFPMETRTSKGHVSSFWSSIDFPDWFFFLFKMFSVMMKLGCRTVTGLMGNVRVLTPSPVRGSSFFMWSFRCVCPVFPKDSVRTQTQCLLKWEITKDERINEWIDRGMNGWMDG